LIGLSIESDTEQFFLFFLQDKIFGMRRESVAKGDSNARFHNDSGAHALSFYFAIVLCSLFVLLRRDSTSQEFAIQVGTPRRGSTQRINTIYAAKNAMNHNQSGIYFSPLGGNPT
jgi:hypothetical protein